MNHLRYISFIRIAIKITAFIPLSFGVASVVVLWQDAFFLFSFIPALFFSYLSAYLLISFRRLFEFIHESSLKQHIYISENDFPLVGSLIVISFFRAIVSILILAILPFLITQILPTYIDLELSQMSGILLLWGAAFGFVLMGFTQLITNYQLEEMAPLYALALIHSLFIVVLAANVTLVTVIGLMFGGVLLLSLVVAEYSSFILRQQRGPVESFPAVDTFRK